MAVPSDIAPRVTRMLAGEWHLEDIPRLFKWARDTKKIPWNTPVRDVADFDAHMDERDKGLTWQLGVAFCARQRLLPLGPDSHLPTLDDLIRAQEAMLTITQNSDPVAKIGMTHDQVAEHLKTAIGKLKSFDGRTETFKTPLTAKEKLIYGSFRQMRSIPFAFTAFSLTEQLANFLITEGVLEPAKKSDFLKLQCRIGAFAISRMHLTKLKLGKVPGSATLAANTSSKHPGKLVVHLQYEPPGATNIVNVVPIYLSSCDAKDWVVDELLPVTNGRVEMAQGWPALDVNAEGKLRPFDPEWVSTEQAVESRGTKGGPLFGRFNV